jgi:hypothetical protein
MSEPAPTTQTLRPTASGTRSECRACRVGCDRVVYPSACIERSCPNLYAYESWEGQRFVGCLRRVFAPEIDHDLLRVATEAGGFGALRCTGAPLPICKVAVEQAYPHRLDLLGCVDPEFAEPAHGETIRVIAVIQP